MSWKTTATLLIATVFAIAAWGQEPARTVPGPAALPPVEPPGRPAIGLALEGGGALGMAHIGVLEWLEEHHVPVDRLAGTSMGALVGGMYATGHSPAELHQLAVSSVFNGIFTLQTSYADESFRRRQDRRRIPDAVTIGLQHTPRLRNALLSDLGINEFLSSELIAYNSADLDFNRFPIPFRCVATDLNTLQAVTFAGGPLATAVRASISIPGVFSPVEDANGHYLADGGILDNLPTDAVRHDLQADAVIAVRLQDAVVSGVDVSSIAAVLNRAFAAGTVHNVDLAERLADVVVTVPVGNFTTTDYDKGAQLIDAGYQAAERNRAVLLRYALDDEGWKAYMAARVSRSRAQPGVLRRVRVDGGIAAARVQVLGDMKPLEGQPVSPASTQEALKNIQSNGVYAATWETFAPAPSGGAAQGQTPDAGILVHLRRDPTGPPFLLVGPNLAASTSNITRMVTSFRLIDQDLGGFGSELRAEAALGYRTELSTEYYRLLNPGGFYIQPVARIVRQPVYIWSNQKRVAERFQQDLAAGIEAGRTFGNSVQVSAAWRAQDAHWRLTTGSGGGPDLSGTAQTGLLRINVDRETSGTVSPSGFRLAASAGAFYHAAGSANAPLVMLSTDRSWQLNPRDIVGLGAEINSYLRANVAEPYRFTLGGPRRLSASSFDEYRGTDTGLTRMGYLRRIAALPTGLGSGLYSVVAYEAGEVWSPEQRSILRQDGTAGLVAATPFGAITFGVSIGDAGHRKVFFTLGPLF